MSVRALLRWWRAPLWVLALGTGAKSFIDNPILGSRRLNRRGLHIARLKLAHRLAHFRRRRLASNLPSQLREQFDRDGFLEIRGYLPADVFTRLQQELLSREFEARQHQQGDAITRRVAIGPDILAATPDLRTLLRDRSLRSLLAYAASTRAEPIYYIQTVIMGHSPGDPDPQLELHADTFHPSLKAWLFLTDVTDDEGPLTYVPGSHRLTPQRVAWEQQRSIAIHDSDRLSQRGSLRIRPEELDGLALPQPKRFAVPANTLVIVDTCGFHARGSCSKPTVRAEIWAYARRTPFVPWAGFNLLALGPIAVRRASWLMTIVDLLDALGLYKQHWRPTKRKRVVDY
ncbi:MAG TPA: phytanoyl-CoA dioxygenase family protein [Sphingomicrobium sp.]|nr:phytanoyl-CoA dioxygenase family protein [Sphingomicrobium sp.]